LKVGIYKFIKRFIDFKGLNSVLGCSKLKKSLILKMRSLRDMIMKVPYKNL